MTRETKIGLLVGLGFVILFGLILGERTQLPEQADGMAVQPPTVPRSNAGQADLLTVRQQQTPTEPAPVYERPAELHLPQRVRADDPAADVWQLGPRESAPPEPVERRESARPPLAQPYTVQEGDSLIKIAGKVYGVENWRQYKRIFEANRDRLPDESTVTPGQQLVIPPLPSAAAPAGGERHYQTLSLDETREYLQGLDGGRREPARAGRTYQVQRGDTLTAVARKTMRSDSREAVQKLYQANQDQLASPDSLKIGMVLRIPG